jgi:hypothetical protein
MVDTTVIYYTHNLEDVTFEQRVRETLQESMGDLPLITVSQKPIDFGHNICVGKIGASAMNILRQIQIGAKATNTKYVSLVEADCLFPPEFFQFRPLRDDTWYNPGYAFIIWWPTSVFWRKHFRELIGAVNREHLLFVVDKLLKDPPRWIDVEMKKYTRRGHIPLTIPVVTIKTKDQMRDKSPHAKWFLTELPMWGTGNDLWSKYTS